MNNTFIDIPRLNNWHQIKQILHTELGLTNIRESTFNEDTKQCTDIVGYDISYKMIRIAIRIRDYKYRDRFNDFTIRSTQYPKLKVKDIQYYLYGWQSAQIGIREYYILDMTKIRQSGILEESYNLKYNNDGTKFYVIPFKNIQLNSVYVHTIIE